jgi:glycosyltransferase involved in cell wall biosynthesis
MSELVFVVPGRLDQLTGGYLYDRKIVEVLRGSGRAVKVIELAPVADGSDFTTIPDGTTMVIDGLAFPQLEEAVAAQAHRLRLVALIHHSLAAETGISFSDAAKLARLEAALLPRFRGVLCPSRETAAAMARSGVPPERIAVVPPGTAKPVPSVRPRHRRARALLCVANLVARKGHRVLVEALARIRDLDWRLLCIGSPDRDPATARAVCQMIRSLGLERRIRLAGEWPHASLTRAYRAADIFGLPSFHEGYGMAIAESMAHGLPIIATTAGAIPQTVPGEAALLLPPGDPAALAPAAPFWPIGPRRQDNGIPHGTACSPRAAVCSQPSGRVRPNKLALTGTRQASASNNHACSSTAARGNLGGTRFASCVRRRGFQSADTVRATVPDGKRAGVIIAGAAIRASGRFTVRTAGGVGRSRK